MPAFSIKKWFGIFILSLLIGCLFANKPFAVEAQSEQEFLTPPYYGAMELLAIFDHEYPTRYTIMTPEDIPGSVVNRDGSRHTAGPCSIYSGHAGIDYRMLYDYVLATHNGQVVEAKWQVPENRRLHLGLYVEIEVTLSSGDRYKTRYGHLSTLLVEKGQFVTQKSAIGISGHTGNSTTPHLHFEVHKWHDPGDPEIPARFYPVNPYGWNSTNFDPWQTAPVPGGRPASVNLWTHTPAITEPGKCSYPSGQALPTVPYPPLTPDYSHPAHLVIDDTDGSRFRTLSGSAWKWRTCKNSYIDPDYDFCYSPNLFGATAYYYDGTHTHEYAEWEVLKEDLLGYYDVYAYIPSKYSNSTLAYYEIRHSNQIRSAGIAQSHFHRWPGDTTWAYLGRYNFSQSTFNQPNKQWVRVHHIPNPTNPREIAAADAVVFIRADGPPDLILPISHGSDDAGPAPGDCGFSTGFPEIYLGHCNNGTDIVSGFRYHNVGIPAGATIIRAHLEFNLDGPYTVPLLLRFYAHYNPNSPTFSNNARPEHRTPLTTEWVSWDISADDQWFVYTRRISPDLAPIVQEMVNHPAWTQGQSALTFIVKPAPNFSGNDHRRVIAYERNQPPGQYSARLLVWYEE